LLVILSIASSSSPARSERAGVRFFDEATTPRE